MDQVASFLEFNGRKVIAARDSCILAGLQGKRGWHDAFAGQTPQSIDKEVARLLATLKPYSS